VTDCRQKFDNLVALTKRKPGCCLVSVAPSDLAAGTTLQAVIDQAVGLAEGVTVCLNPGVYVLEQPLRLGPRHANLALESCGGRAILEPDFGVNNPAFAEGLIIIEGAVGVTLRGLVVVLPFALIPRSATDAIGVLAGQDVATDSFLASLAASLTMIGLNVVESRSLTVEDCEFSITGRAGSAATILGICIFLRGNCSTLTVTHCAFRS